MTWKRSLTNWFGYLADRFLRLFALAIALYIIIRKEEPQQIVTITCLVIAVVGIKQIEEFVRVVIDKLCESTRGKFGLAEWDTTETDIPKQVREPDGRFEKLMGDGKIYVAQGRTDRAISCFEEALKIGPDFEAHHILSFLYGEKLGNKPKAIFHCQEALAIQPNSPNAKFNLAVYTNHLRGAKESFPIYEEATALIARQGLQDSEIDGKAHLFMGHDLMRLSRKSEAIEQYKKAVEILKKLADGGSQSGLFWLRDAEKNLKAAEA